MPACGRAAPGSADPDSCYCAVENLLGIIRRRYSLAVLRVVSARRGCRYRDVAAAVSEASSSTLAETLSALESAHLLERSLEDPAHPVYAPTASGEKLLSRLRRLLEDVQSS